ncbi:MAG TPA: hypothetical protein VMT16_12865 [Thermoanaerobaculia bacterium]|nr:hypothetical protein [Thermoanaerobaculia bacterium]
MAIGTLPIGIPTSGRVLGGGRKVTLGSSPSGSASGAGDTFQRADAAAAAYQRDRELMLAKQQEMQRQAELYTFLSNMLKMMHDTIMRIIGNIR